MFSKTALIKLISFRSTVMVKGVGAALLAGLKSLPQHQIHLNAFV